MLRQKNQARAQLAGAPILVAQLGALEFRKRMLQGNSSILRTLRMGTFRTVADLLKDLGQIPPLELLRLCYKGRGFDFGESLLRHADDLDFVQEILSATGNSSELNSILNGVLAGFNRRRRHHRFKYAHQNLAIDRLRFADTTSPLDSDFQASDIKTNAKSGESNKVKSKGEKAQFVSLCIFFQRSGDCRSRNCRFSHKCAICSKPGHGATDCIRRRYSAATEYTNNPRDLTEADNPPNPRTRRNRAL